MHAFTGAPTEYYFNKNGALNEEQTWQLIRSACENNFIITTSIDDFPESKIKQGLVELKYFTIVNCLEIEQVRFIQMRNIKLDYQWSGQWQANSSLWTEELKQKCNQKQILNEGMFFVDLKEFRQRFSFFEICYNHDGFVYQSLTARQNYIHHACFFELTVNQFGIYYITVEQKNIRHQLNFARQNYSTIQLLLAKKNGENNYTLIDLKKNNDREFWIKSELPKGDYIIYIRPYWYDTDIKREFLVSSFSSNEVKLAQTPRVKNFLKYLFLGEQKLFIEQSQFQDVQYQLVKEKQKGIGYYWVRNKSVKKHVSIKTEFRINKAYKFKKPVRNGNCIMKVEPMGEDIAIFTMQNLDYEELKILDQQISYVD